MTDSPAFYHVSNIERPLSSIRNYAAGLAMISETMGEEGLVVQEMSWAITDLVKKIEEDYSALFKLTHPNRDRFEREGWPEDSPLPDKPE
jgi:hypothetical protein